MALVVVAACGVSSAPRATGTLEFHPPSGGATLRVEIAETGEARARGLMDRTSLGPDSGMAFLYPGPTEATFWMKDTVIPLSVAFWDQRGRILAILDMEPCRADPCPRFAAPAPFVGAVEANRGWFGRHGVEPGAFVKLSRP